MKNDILTMLKGEMPLKRPSKETLNHAELVYLASGVNPYSDTKTAYLKAYESLGIDLLNRVPDINAPLPLKQGESKDYNETYMCSSLGLYDTFHRKNYPFGNCEEFFEAEKPKLNYHELITPVPHKLNEEDIAKREKIAGDIGVYYYQIYTTLFMWGVEYLGWEVFMTAAITEPDLFKEKFLDPAFENSLKLIEILSKTDCPFVFCHDDLAASQGPMFNPKWYNQYIFPKYPKLWEPVKKAGKKVIYVADGNMELFLEPLAKSGVDGVMIESPSTDFNKIIDVFGDKIIIGGIDTKILTFGTTEQVKKHVFDVAEKTKNITGYVMSSSGGLHGNIPLKNLEAYFDARVITGQTPSNWRKA